MISTITTITRTCLLELAPADGAQGREAVPERGIAYLSLLFLCYLLCVLLLLWFLFLISNQPWLNNRRGRRVRFRAALRPLIAIRWTPPDTSPDGDNVRKMQAHANVKPRRGVGSVTESKRGALLMETDWLP